MSIWDDYKTSVRTRINVKQDRLLLTERQWKLKHYVKLNDKCGKYLWINDISTGNILFIFNPPITLYAPFESFEVGWQIFKKSIEFFFCANFALGEVSGIQYNLSFNKTITPTKGLLDL